MSSRCRRQFSDRVFDLYLLNIDQYRVGLPKFLLLGRNFVMSVQHHQIDDFQLSISIAPHWIFSKPIH